MSAKKIGDTFRELYVPPLGPLDDPPGVIYLDGTLTEKTVDVRVLDSVGEGVQEVRKELFDLTTRRRSLVEEVRAQNRRVGGWSTSLSGKCRGGNMAFSGVLSPKMKTSIYFVELFRRFLIAYGHLPPLAHPPLIFVRVYTAVYRFVVLSGVRPGFKKRSVKGFPAMWLRSMCSKTRFETTTTNEKRRKKNSSDSWTTAAGFSPSSRPRMWVCLAA